MQRQPPTHSVPFRRHVSVLFDMYVALRIAVEREARVASDDARRSASASDGHKPSNRRAPAGQLQSRCGRVTNSSQSAMPRRQ
jgi:hypothetical protein